MFQSILPDPASLVRVKRLVLKQENKALTNQKGIFLSFRMFEHPPGEKVTKISTLARFMHFMKIHKMKGHLDDK
jgi:hypothetical protein